MILILMFILRHIWKYTVEKSHTNVATEFTISYKAPPLDSDLDFVKCDGYSDDKIDNEFDNSDLTTDQQNV